MRRHALFSKRFNVMMDNKPCPICQTETVALGTTQGAFKPITFYLRRCPECHFSFVANPWTDYANIYSEAYYTGKGADPLVDYLFELEHPEQTIRLYEWRGIVRIIRALTPLSLETRWLDFGCGNGGLVRHCRQEIGCDAVGFEEGWIRQKAAGYGIPFLDADQLEAQEGTFDVVTAIEVLEHVPEPVAVLKRIRRLLKPGGLFFATTGNARPFRERLLSWRYVRPEIHISFFEPDSLVRALELAGFHPEFRGFLPGFADVIRFKLLKNLHMRRRAWFYQAVPWAILTRLLDRRLQISGLPIGWAAPVPQSARESQREQYAGR
jgi:SAM-dependent methyltransferase